LKPETNQKETVIMNRITRRSRPVTQSNAFVQAMQVANNFTRTENGAVTNKSTLNDVLDFFGAGGALRQRTEQDIVNLFTRAFAEDRLTALKILFYFRDVREGQGERRTFRTIFKWLATNYPDVARKNLENVAFFGRYDDLYALVGTPLESDVFALFAKQLKADLKGAKAGEPISLLAKWLKSENTSAADSRRLAIKTFKALELTPKRYRKILTALRKHIDVLETKMCSGEWSSIDFESVPSKASLNYRKAFGRHEQERYAKYLKSVEKGEAKMNAGAVYPYEIFRSIWGSPTQVDLQQADAQWKSMPNFLEGNEHYGLVIADTSQSMNSNNMLPIQVSVSLAIYFAERNVGPFKDMWMSFSDTPSFQKLRGQTLHEKYQNMGRDHWGFSTNLQAAFDLILNTAVQNNVPEKEMPAALYIISDMEFNATGGQTNYDAIRQKYARAGYKLPRLVWWNVNSRNDQHPIRSDAEGTALVSGASPSILKSLLAAKSFSPMDVVYETVNKPRYERITL
jgi:hypothetical protein